MNILLALLCCNTCGILNNELSDNSSPKVVIVGAGAAGIAAASRLLENGFTDVTILEAGNRIGGRVHSIKFGDYMIDMGAQWVHGEKNNVAFELAWPLGLLESSRANFDMEFNYFLSSGKKLPADVTDYLREIEEIITTNITGVENLKIGSFGEFAERKYEKYFAKHPGIREDWYKSLLYSLNLAEMMSDGAEDWYEVSARGLRDYAQCEGDQNNNWKNRTYSTILDILMKKYPNPEDELPVLENTKKNNKVMKINYSEDSESIQVLTANGEEYLADHVIFTPSLGVLKVNYTQLFDPPLPETKVEAIETLGFGRVAKIWLYYDNPWWNSTGYKFIVNPIVWDYKDAMRLGSRSRDRWMMGVYGVMSVEHKPNLLCLWMASNYALKMEYVPQDRLHGQVFNLLKKFYGRHYQVTKPTKILRTSWNTDENFYGTYSFHSVEAENAHVSYADLAEPIMRNNKPVLLFAGEATSEHYSTVHGAIDSGWREADRLINLYPKKNDGAQLLKQLTEISKLKIN